MKSLRPILAMSALALAAATAPSHAAIGDVYSSTFQGATFTFTQTDANTLTFEFAATALTGDWSTALYLGAFDLKDLGIDFSTATATANGPGATNLAGLNSQLSAASVDCQAAGSPPGSICFDISPDLLLSAPFDFLYTIDFSQNLNIASTGVHLQIALSETQNGPKVGSLYSQNVGLSSSSSSSSSGGGGGSGAPEPASSFLAVLGLGLLGASFWTRRKA